jgi:hypothetical protein
VTKRLIAALIFLSLASTVGRELRADDDPLRVVVIKVDGLSPFVLDAAVDPSSPSAEKLPYPVTWRRAHEETSSVLARARLVPNLESYFYRNGIRTETMLVGTLALSAPSWGMIDTGQASIVKTNSYFNRYSGELTSYLDQLRESMSVGRGAGRTTALWQLDLLGVPLMIDHFSEDRVWASIQFYYRNRPIDQLSKLMSHLVRGGAENRNPFSWLRRHLNNQLTKPDYPEKHDYALAELTSQKILEKDVSGRERYDVLSVIFASLDHEFHVDPNYRNLLGWLVKLDNWVGQILAAVERSDRRDSTVVVLISDHGLDFNPLLLNFSYPINPWLRKSDFGSHTVIAPVAEDHEHALSVPVRGVDFNRVYEGEASPYGTGVPFGEKGYVTAFTANNGNPRFDAYFRNSDLNRLHLLLLEVRRLRRDQKTLRELYPSFLHAYQEVCSWLQPEIDRSLVVTETFESRIRELSDREDPRSLDEMRRLRQEIEAYRGTAATLRNLADVPTAEDGWLSWASSRFKISELIPKGYWGPPNSLRQLQNYVVGWETGQRERWGNGVVPDFRTLDYARLFPGVQASSPNARGERHPFHFFAASLPLEHIQPYFDKHLRQAIWLVFEEAQGEAIVAESEQGELWYESRVRYDSETNRFSRQQEPGIRRDDPLDYGPMAGRWLSPREWAKETAEKEFVVVPVILADLFRENYSEFLPAGKSTPALDFHFAQQKPDFRVWTNRGWNVNSNSHTPGGTHGGFSPLDVRSIFAAWGGERTGLKRGEVIPGSFFTYDITPTVLEVTGHRKPGDGGEGQRWHPDAATIPLLNIP